MKKITVLSVFILALVSCQNTKQQEDNPSTNATNKDTIAVAAKKMVEPEIMPISHASFVMKWNDKTWYNDPVGGADKYASYPPADVVIISDIHGDHLNLETLVGLPGNFQLIAPQAVYNQLPENLQAKTKIMNNGDSLNWEGFSIEAVPMYNITEDRLKFHEKGRGNGYVIRYQNFDMYISGDTENIEEMKALTNIDLALVCMNLPYTMSVEQAADGVTAFAPKRVIPYHFRGMKENQPHFFNVKEFERLVSKANPSIVVEQMNWYPENEL